jgi:glc operon protein GlcG
MFKLVAVLLAPLMAMYANDLPSRKYLNLAAIKTMVAASEAKAKEMNVEVTICIVDESGNLPYGAPSREAAESVKKGNVQDLAFPDFFPNQGGLPIKVDGQVLGGIAASGAKSEVDEQIAQAGLDALLRK